MSIKNSLTNMLNQIDEYEEVEKILNIFNDYLNQKKINVSKSCYIIINNISHPLIKKTEFIEDKSILGRYGGIFENNNLCRYLINGNISYNGPHNTPIISCVIISDEKSDDRKWIRHKMSEKILYTKEYLINKKLNQIKIIDLINHQKLTYKLNRYNTLLNLNSKIHQIDIIKIINSYLIKPINTYNFNNFDNDIKIYNKNRNNYTDSYSTEHLNNLMHLKYLYLHNLMYSKYLLNLIKD